MKKKWGTLALSGALLCSLGVPAWAAGDGASASGAAKAADTGDIQPLPDSELYCGTLKEQITGEDGTAAALYMESSQFGEYVMNLSGETLWIDGGRRVPCSPSDLVAGETLYVFRSPVSTRSIPPQSAAFAVVRNVPQGACCAHYHKVEAVEERDGEIQITTSNGGLLLYIGEATTRSAYAGTSAGGLDGIVAGGHIVAWYAAVALSYPGQAYVQHIMTLP